EGGIRDAVERHPRHLSEAVEHARGETRLVADDVLEGRVELGAAVAALAERGDEIDRREHAGERLMAHRARLEAMTGGELAGRADAVGGPALEQLLARKPETLVRPEELVGRAQQHVGAQR